MISTAVIPIICGLVDNGALNVYSQRDVRRVIDLAEEIESNVEHDGGKFQVCPAPLDCLFSDFHLHSALTQVRNASF